MITSEASVITRMEDGCKGLAMCVFCSPVMFKRVSIFSVVWAGMTTEEHDVLCAAARNAGASSPPLAVKVHVPGASGSSEGEVIAETAKLPTKATKIVWITIRSKYMCEA